MHAQASSLVHAKPFQPEPSKPISPCRTVRALTLRLADVEQTPASQGRQAIAAALPLLLETGLPSQVAEVQALALDTTCRLAAAAGPELLRPHMPALVPAMLESLRRVGIAGGSMLCSRRIRCRPCS